MITKVIVALWTIWIASTFVRGIASIEPNTGAEVEGLVVIFSMLFHFVVWCTIAVPTIMISRLFGETT